MNIQNPRLISYAMRVKVSCPNIRSPASSEAVSQFNVPKVPFSSMKAKSLAGWPRLKTFRHFMHFRLGRETSPNPQSVAPLNCSTRETFCFQVGERRPTENCKRQKVATRTLLTLRDTTIEVQQNWPN